MRKRFVGKAFFVLMMVAALACAVPALANPYVAVGVLNQADERVTYGYGELALTPALSASVEFYTNSTFVLGLWQGVQRGAYGEVEFGSGGGVDTVELGVWATVPLLPSVSATGWVGAQSELGTPGVWAKANAELSFGLSDSVALLFGGDTTLLKKDTTTSTWFGVGYTF